MARDQGMRNLNEIGTSMGHRQVRLGPSPSPSLTHRGPNHITISFSQRLRTEPTESDGC